MYLISQVLSCIPIAFGFLFACLLCIGADRDDGKLFFGAIAVLLFTAFGHIFNWWA